MNLNRLTYFAAVVDAGSFTKAAERLAITKAVVSQQVAQLEQDLRTTLLVRTTRRVQPTEAGLKFHARCAAILRAAEEAFDEVDQAAAEPTGILRITSSNDYGTSVIVPLVAAFTARYPSCRAEVLLNDAAIDLVSDGVDLAIRIGWLEDSSLQARRIGDFKQILVAPPCFADRIDALGGPDDLASLPFIANLALRDPLTWQFSRGGTERRTVRMGENIAIDSTPGVLTAVKAGGGLSVLPDYQIAEDLAAGRLIHVLPEWQLRAGGIYTVYPAARFRPPKVTAFVDMLIAAEKEKRVPPHTAIAAPEADLGRTGKRRS